MNYKVWSVLLVTLFSLSPLSAQVAERIALPAPKRTGGMPLFEALDKRQTIRSYSMQVPDLQVISNLLWAASGINRPDGRRTAPTARNMQEIDIYVIMEDGWYLFEPGDHSLLKMGTEDLREHAGSQDFVRTAPLNLIYVADYDKMGGNDESKAFYSATDTGFISQNVYLFCASEGMATVVRGLVDRDKLRSVLGLRSAQHVVLGQTVGYPGG